MGTNYYFCPDAFRGTNIGRIHIGKSSGGWCFSVHIYPDSGIETWEDWKSKFWYDGWHILDEYGASISIGGMIEIVEKRRGINSWEAESRWGGYQGESAFHERNYSERGPNNLLRHRINEANHCVSHGEGTWDCIIGEFS